MSFTLKSSYFQKTREFFFEWPSHFLTFVANSAFWNSRQNSLFLQNFFVKGDFTNFSHLSEKIVSKFFLSDLTLKERDFVFYTICGQMKRVRTTLLFHDYSQSQKRRTFFCSMFLRFYNIKKARYFWACVPYLFLCNVDCRDICIQYITVDILT